MLPGMKCINDWDYKGSRRRYSAVINALNVSIVRD